MTKKIISVRLGILIALMFLGVSYAHASEVTGTLSSGVSHTTQTEGSIGGNVSGGNTISGTVSNDTSSGGGSSRGNGGIKRVTDANSTVLGSSIALAQSPTFPNAGERNGEGVAISLREMMIAVLMLIGIVVSTTLRGGKHSL